MQPNRSAQGQHPAITQAEADVALGRLGRVAIAAVFLLAVWASDTWPWGWFGGGL